MTIDSLSRCALLAALLLLSIPAATATGAPHASARYRGTLDVARFDVSPSLRELPPTAPPSGPLRPIEAGAAIDRLSVPGGLFSLVWQDTDPVVQDRVGGLLIPVPTRSFNTVSNSDNGPASYWPPDPGGDVGPNHYAVMANAVFAVYNKTGGAAAYGPVASRTPWSGFGGACENDDGGYPTLLYDQFADRWLLTKIATDSTFWYLCVALSTSGDPAGSYNRWAISPGANIPDYLRAGIWRDAYYFATTEYGSGGAGFKGIGAYALNRAQALAGQANPGVLSFLVPPAAAPYLIGGGLLPADIDGPTLPPSDSPAYWVGTMDNDASLGAPQDALTLWEFRADFANPSNSSFALAHTLPIAPFDTMYSGCSGSPARSCIPQPGTSNRVDILSYRQHPMHRLAYRNFGSHASLVTNQSVETTGSGGPIAGIRWWEIRNPNATPILQQDATYAPGVSDGIHRWLGSIAMDGSGNMGLGYSVSSGTVAPGIRYTGRLATDPVNTMAQGEGIFFTGVGSQTSTQLWGRQSSMNVDSADDCTFWFVNQHYPGGSGGNWTLGVGAFRFSECGIPTFTLSASPSQQTICRPDNGGFTVSVGSTAGFTNPVALSLTGTPAGASANFAPNPATPGSASALTLGNMGVVAAGSYPMTVTGTQGATTRTAPVTLNVVASPPGQPLPTSPANDAVDITPIPTLAWAAVAGATGYVVEVAVDSGFTQVVRSANVNGTSWPVTPALAPNTTYRWRVRASNGCVGSNSIVYTFTTGNAVCYPGPALLIPDNTTTGVSASITVPAGTGSVKALRAGIDLSHEFVGNLIVQVSGPGASATVISRPINPGLGTGSCSGDDILATFFDGAAATPNTCVSGVTPTLSGEIQPNQPLSVFDGASAPGTWTLNVSDRAAGSLGRLNRFCLEFSRDRLYANGFE